LAAAPGAMALVAAVVPLQQAPLTVLLVRSCLGPPRAVRSRSACRTAGYLDERTSRPRRVMPPATPYLPRSGSVHSSPVEAFSPRVISQRTRHPWSGSPGGGPCEALMAAERILRALPSCWSGTLWGDGGSVAPYRVVGATADALATLLGWCAPFPISPLRSQPHPNEGAFTARANGWEPARQDPAGRLPADDRPGRSPCRVPHRSGRRFPRHPENQRPSHGRSGRTGRLPGQEHVGDSPAVMGCRCPLAV
jgi:hypothetical protein